MKKKERRKLNAILADLLTANKEEIEFALERDGMIELVADFGGGNKVSLGVLYKEDQLRFAPQQISRPFFP